MKQAGRYYDDDYDQHEEEAGDDLVLGDHNEPEVADEIATLTTSVNNLVAQTAPLTRWQSRGSR